MHVEKYTAAQIGQMLTHYNRNNGQPREYENKDIDASRTKDNYNLCPEERGADYIQERLSEVKHINRKDINVMCSWIVTLPKDYTGDERAFFKESYNILADKYGEKNVVSAYVHCDERGQNHLHFAFMPVMIDKSGQERLCAKEVINRQELKQMHPFVERELNNRLHEPVRLMNDATRDGNKTVTELKRESELREQERIKAETREERDNLQSARDALQSVQKDLKRERDNLQIAKDINKSLPKMPSPDGRGLHRGYYTEQAVKEMYNGFRENWLLERQRAGKEEERANKAEHELSRHSLTPQQERNPEFLRERAQEIERNDGRAERETEEWFRSHNRDHERDRDR